MRHKRTILLHGDLKNIKNSQPFAVTTQQKSKKPSNSLFFSFFASKKDADDDDIDVYDNNDFDKVSRRKFKNFSAYQKFEVFC